MYLLYKKFKSPEVTELGEGWYAGFSKRNELRTRWSTDLEGRRQAMANVGTISAWFTEVYEKIDLSLYDPKFIFNCDESMIETKNKVLCVVRKSQKFAIIEDDELSEHLTIMVTISCSGDSMTPFIIIPLKNLPETLDTMVKDGKITIAAQDSGWMDKATFKLWTGQFVEFVKLRRASFNMPNVRALLFIDSHSSRENPEALQMMKNNNIDVLTYPGECSHILQALDVGIFAPFKRFFKLAKRCMQNVNLKWKDGIDGISVSDRSTRRAKHILAAIDALHQATTYTAIKYSFQRSGIYPRNKEIALSNPRINPSETNNLHLVEQGKRKRISITSKIITSDEVINQLSLQQEEMKSKKKKKQR